MLAITLLLALVVGSSGFFQFGDGGGMQFEFGGDPFGGVRKAPDANVEVQVSLEDFYIGKTLSLSFQRRATCATCKGTGAKTLKTCNHCKGRGVMRHPIHPIQQACPHCGGQGKIPAVRCPTCSGQKTTRETVAKEVVLPPGSPDGFEVRLPKLADEHPGHEAGDVVVRVKGVPHSRFARSGSTLKTTIPISVGEALLGFSRTVDHLDGHAVTISSDGVSQHMSKQVIKGEGMPLSPKKKAMGNLEATLQVKFPSRLTPLQVDALRAAFPEEFVRVEEALEAGQKAEEEDAPSGAGADEDDEGDDEDEE